eukprot:TRINITY_DN37557_c0_g1_i1.p1 TRINITY_DN37557_c0_g1~~TRINITY_DN37557_c0_g1_i1.p1  ORF type:complete len:458 (+),score=19.26 TRINITY_DN37557_c0_g1_i1:61-1374(+)
MVLVFLLSLNLLSRTGFSQVRLQTQSECAELANLTWANHGGPSAGLTYCIRELGKTSNYSYEDIVDRSGVAGVTRMTVNDFMPSYHVTMSKKQRAVNRRFPVSGDFGETKWFFPDNYQRSADEPRLLFVHGSYAISDTFSADYLGLIERLVKWTGLPVLACNYPTEPLAPWPQNVRSVLSLLSYAMHHGPRGPGHVGPLFMFADSEGTLLVMQTIVAINRPQFLSMMGYGHLMQDVRKHLVGVILSSPVVDVSCETPSMAWNCFNAAGDTGDPDVGRGCDVLPTFQDKIWNCRGSYLSYFYGFEDWTTNSSTDISLEWEKRREFFERDIINPLRADMSGFPPLLLLAGVRDYYYSDSPTLARLACLAGVHVETFNVVGAFHDFIEYTEGCRGSEPMEEAVEAFRRIRKFVAARIAGSFSSSPPRITKKGDSLLTLFF